MANGEPYPLLKGSNMKTDGGLAHMQRRLRTGKTTMLGYRKEYREAFQISSGEFH